MLVSCGGFFKTPFFYGAKLNLRGTRLCRFVLGSVPSQGGLAKPFELVGHGFSNKQEIIMKSPLDVRTLLLASILTIVGVGYTAANVVVVPMAGAERALLYRMFYLTTSPEGADKRHVPVIQVFTWPRCSSCYIHMVFGTISLVGQLQRIWGREPPQASQAGYVTGTNQILGLHQVQPTVQFGVVSILRIGVLLPISITPGRVK